MLLLALAEGGAVTGCGGAASSPRGSDGASADGSPTLSEATDEAGHHATTATRVDAIAEGSADGAPSGSHALPSKPSDYRFRGMWVLCEGSQRVLRDAARMEDLITRAEALGVTDLFVQVYRGGRAWYDAELADAEPYHEIVALTGMDPFAHLIARAHAREIRVHAWVNVLSLNKNRTAPIAVDLGTQAIHVDRRGRSLLDYPGLDVPSPDRAWYRMGTPGLYLDPGAPGVRERLVATFTELLAKYPELAGLHLDYIRHPGVLPFVPGSRFGVGLDFGYGEATRTRFRRENGLNGPYADAAKPSTSALVNTTAWDDWRRDQVTALVSEIRTAALAEHPDLLISAAVIPYPDRAYLSLAQDWRGWLEAGLVDFAIPMLYTKDDRLLRYQVEALAQGPNADRIWMGLGTWLFANEPARALAQLETVAAANATGEVLFSYDSIADSTELLETLVGARRHASKPAARGH